MSTSTPRASTWTRWSPTAPSSGRRNGRQIARQAGRTWGGYLAGQPAPFQQVTGEEAIARLTALLTGLGFEPELEAAGLAATIRLRHCPFLELAERYDQLVCRIHLGVMQGALRGLRAPVTATALEPFAEPGACLARVERARAA